MSIITTKDGTRIFYKDWGPKDAQPIVFHHGWPLSADDWDNQMLFFLQEGYRVVAHDRRGHGRSDQTDQGNEMDTYASDVEDLVTELDLKNAIHIGHSTGGGEVAHYVARAQPGRVAKAVLLEAVPPVMVKKESNPGGTPLEVFDGYRAALMANRAQLYLDIPTGPFYGFNRPGAQVSQGLIYNWWRQGMMGSVKAGYECIKAFSETDFTEDLKKIDVPVLVIHSEDDQIVPYADSGPLSAKLLRNGTLKTYKDLPHGCAQTNPDPSRHRRDDPFTTTIDWPNFHSGANGDFQQVDIVSPGHPLLADPDSPTGAIRYLPSHPHEGGIGAPEGEGARVILKGRSKVSGIDFNIAVAFERGVHGGPAVAQSTFHHFADYNWDPEAGCPSFVTEAPGDGMKRFPEALTSTHRYMLNLANWLSSR